VVDVVPQAVTTSILTVLVVLVFYYAMTTVESQLQYSEFTSAAYSLQVLSNFDDGAFRLGDSNYVVLTLQRGRIDVGNFTAPLRVYVGGKLVYEATYATVVPEYVGGWLVSTPTIWYRGDAHNLTTSSIVLTLHAEQRGGARIVLRPRVRVLPLGVYRGRIAQGREYREYIVAVYVPRLVLGECGGGSPYHLVLTTEAVNVTTLREDAGNVMVELGGESLTLPVPPDVDWVALAIVESTVRFEVRGV